MVFSSRFSLPRSLTPFCGLFALQVVMSYSALRCLFRLHNAFYYDSLDYVCRLSVQFNGEDFCIPISIVYFQLISLPVL